MRASNSGLPSWARGKAGRQQGVDVKYIVVLILCLAFLLLFYNTHSMSSRLATTPTATAAAAGGAQAAAGAVQQQAAAAGSGAGSLPQAAAAAGGGGRGAAAARAAVVGDPEIWARGPQKGAAQDALLKLMDAQALGDIKALCGRALYRTLTSYVRVHDFGRFTVVLTGDIPAMWLRDSAVQMASYFPRVARRPAIRQVLEGAIRAQAYFILQDPWANAYNPHYIPLSKMKKNDRLLGRGGWVWTRNFELDSVAYFFNFLWNFHQTPAIWDPAALLAEPLVHDAVVTMLRLLEVEQHHEQRSPYRYSELARDGLGPPCGVTGMVWSAFRASDDPQKYSYNVPDNMYLWGALARLARLNDAVWRDGYIRATASRLMDDVHKGITQHGIVTIEEGPGAGTKVYAYEVDGLGNELLDFDDPNLPSLLALPLLGYEPYDAAVYNATRSRILSNANAYYFAGSELHGLGSPHTNTGYVWPLATAVEALTSAGQPDKQAELLRMLLKMASGNGLVHESVNVNSISSFTRPEFGWANAMFVVAVENLLGLDCDEEAEKHRLDVIKAREEREKQMPVNGGQDLPVYYEQLEAGIIHHLQFDED